MIALISPLPDFELLIEMADGVTGVFDVKPYLELEAFRPLRDPSQFREIRNGGYYVEWLCGADLSADTVQAHLRITPVDGFRSSPA